jgi:hypothetical protein
MSRVQMSINVCDFGAAVAFYSRLFGRRPSCAPATRTLPWTIRRSSWC